jgi:hypothetical protein
MLVVCAAFVFLYTPDSASAESFRCRIYRLAADTQRVRLDIYILGEPVPFYLFIFSINRVVARIFAVNYYGYAVHSGLVGFDNEVYARFLFGVFKRGRYKNVLTVVGHRVYQNVFGRFW